MGGRGKFRAGKEDRGTKYPTSGNMVEGGGGGGGKRCLQKDFSSGRGKPVIWGELYSRMVGGKKRAFGVQRVFKKEAEEEKKYSFIGGPDWGAWVENVRLGK